MDERTVRRIKSLENSICALRDVNQSDTLRESTKSKNRDLISMYMNEIYDDILDESERVNIPIEYGYFKYKDSYILLS